MFLRENSPRATLYYVPFVFDNIPVAFCGSISSPRLSHRSGTLTMYNCRSALKEPLRRCPSKLAADLCDQIRQEHPPAHYRVKLFPVTSRAEMEAPIRNEGRLDHMGAIVISRLCQAARFPMTGIDWITDFQSLEESVAEYCLHPSCQHLRFSRLSL